MCLCNTITILAYLIVQSYWVCKPWWSDLFAGITQTSPTLLNQVEELTCRGHKYSTAAEVSEIFPFREHQKSWSILVKFDTAPLPQCLNSLDLVIIRLKIGAFSRQLCPLCFSGLYPTCACSPTFNTPKWCVGPWPESLSPGSLALLISKRGVTSVVITSSYNLICVKPTCRAQI